MRRTALVTSPDSTLEQVKAYMPDNYEAREVTFIVVRGEDDAGWTMDDYILPRLASGLHFATEVDVYVPWPIGVCDNEVMP